MLKIKDNVDLKELEKFGFKLNQNNNYEYKDQYPLEDDETRYVDEFGFDYVGRIEIFKRKNGNNELWIEIINCDCSYHTEGPDIGGIMSLIYDLVQAGLVEKVKE